MCIHDFRLLFNTVLNNRRLPKNKPLAIKTRIPAYCSNEPTSDYLFAHSITGNPCKYRRAISKAWEAAQCRCHSRDLVRPMGFRLATQVFLPSLRAM